MKLKIVAAIFAVVAVLAVSTAVFANHQWATYHWPSYNSTLEYIEDTPSLDIAPHIADWNSAGGGKVSYAAAGDPNDFDVFIAEGKLRKTWLGVASILVNTSCVTSSAVGKPRRML